MMDTKKIKMTYDAIIRVPPPFQVYMSANYYKATDTAQYFKQTQPITPSQIVLAVGYLQESMMEYGDDRKLIFVSPPAMIQNVSQELLVVP